MGNFNPPVTEFLTPDEKQEWKKNKLEFQIIDCRHTESKFGPAYTYKMRHVDKKSGEVTVKQLSLVENPRRIEEAEWLMTELAADKSGNGVGPCRLTSVATDQGNDAWMFESAE